MGYGKQLFLTKKQFIFNMKSRITVTIGVPAYNEGENIMFLINDIQKQKLSNVVLEKILVFLDGGNDNTAKKLESLQSKRVVIMGGKKRKGKAYGQNMIINQTKSDALVLLDADIRIEDPLFLEKILNPIQSEKADLVCPRIQEITPKNFFESILFSSMQMKKKLYEAINNGNNIYTCFGRARVLSKKLYTKISFPENIIAEDAYSYLFCLSNNFFYRYINSTCIYYKLPDTFNDHKKQSTRFFNTQKQLFKVFGEQFVKRQYTISPLLLAKKNLEYIWNNPFIAGFYFIVVGYMKILSSFIRTQNKWEIAQSSKMLV